MSFVGSTLDLRLKSVLLATDLSPASVKPLIMLWPSLATTERCYILPTLFRQSPI
jgi:hypothetical protein